MLGFYSIACAVPHIKVGDTKFNSAQICRKLNEINDKRIDFAVFPELSVTGYTCADLFFQNTLIDSVKGALAEIARHSVNMPVLFAVGAPLLIGCKLYDCAVVFCSGKIIGIVPKVYPLTNEKRWFASASELGTDKISVAELGLSGIGEYDIPVGAELIFEDSGVKLAVTIGDESGSLVPPSAVAVANGAEFILNLSASCELVEQREHRRAFVVSQSARQKCVYAYCSAGEGESTTDLVFSGHSIIAEAGRLLCENDRLADSDYMLVTDADLDKIRNKRMRDRAFEYGADTLCSQTPVRLIAVNTRAVKGSLGTMYPVSKTPFLPASRAELTNRCMGIFQTQTAGLKKRIEITSGKAVIGVSGGLDSTLALLVCCQAMRALGRPNSDVIGITMPCFGTSSRTHENAVELMKLLGVTAVEINIKEACRKHCEDIGHDINVLDVTFENIQARERTQVLMDYACRVGGFVVGTGDLSELALGWCTYNADHMSMYGVNSGVPKTLIRHMISAIASANVFEGCATVLNDIVDTPISPELLPPDESGAIKQETESIVGPYELHDFFVYYMLKHNFTPTKIYYLACRAFAGEYDSATVLKWLKVFYKRFFTQQFKRSCQPDGVKIGSIGLSPRGDWSMPSDAAATVWLSEIESINPL